MTNYKIWTDGSAFPNPGKAGWGAIIEDDLGHQVMGSGQVPATDKNLPTNNRAELMAFLEALKALPEGQHSLTLVTDSMYVAAFVRAALIERRDERFKMNSIAPNQDLLEELRQGIKAHYITVEKIRGHSGHSENDRVDALAMSARMGTAVIPFKKLPARARLRIKL